MSYRLSLALAVFCLGGFAHAQNPPAATDKPVAKPAAKPSPLKTDKEKDSYAIGMDIGNTISGQGLDIDLELLVRGLTDAAGKKDTLLTKEEHQKQMMAFRTRMMAKAREKQEAEGRKKFSAQIKKGEDFLAANKKKDGVKTTASGLQYQVIKAGKGATPTKADSVVAHYRGTLLNGTEFDSSSPDKPIEFRVTGVIPGWTEALQLMKVGDKWRLFIPPNLAYGARGAGEKIKPYSTLVFEVELVNVKPPKAPR
jgi:FKBP-type peptidyl-prolyl cis-trans isomerase FklB